MDEIRRLMKELLIEIEMLTPELIEEFCREWVAELEYKDPERGRKPEGFVDAVCDYGKMVAGKMLLQHSDSLRGLGDRPSFYTLFSGRR